MKDVRFVALATCTLLTVALFATGCNPPKAEPMAAKPGEGADGKTEAAPKAAVGSAEKKEQNFTIKTEDADLKVGEKGQSKLLVEPGEGFKINEEYPWKASCGAVEALGVSAVEVGKDDWKLDKKKANLDVALTATKAGSGELSCSLNFSVCNDTQCELIRDHEVKLKLAAK